LTIIIGRRGPHHQLLVGISDRDSRTLNGSAVRILDGAYNRAGDFLRGRGPGQTKAESERYKQSAQNVNVMFHGGILFTGTLKELLDCC